MQRRADWGRALGGWTTIHWSDGVGGGAAVWLRCGRKAGVSRGSHFPHEGRRAVALRDQQQQQRRRTRPLASNSAGSHARKSWPFWI